MIFIETIAEGVTLYLGDCREPQVTENGRSPYLILRKWMALHGRHSNSRSSTPRFICAMRRWSDRPRSLISACSLPPPPFLWLISKHLMSSQPHSEQASLPRPTSIIARRRYRRSASRPRSAGGFHDLSDWTLGLKVRCRTSRGVLQFGHRSRPKPVVGFHVQSHLRQETTLRMGVAPQGFRLGVSASNVSMCGGIHAH